MAIFLMVAGEEYSHVQSLLALYPRALLPLAQALLLFPCEKSTEASSPYELASYCGIHATRDGTKPV